MDNFDEHYRQIVAKQIVSYLVRTLKDKAGGHRACITDLPQSLMDDVCNQMRRATSQVETYILADKPHNELEIGATKLVERRNVSDKVLLVLIPSGLKTAVEDSYGEHTLATLSVRPALYELRRLLLTQLTANFPYVEKIVNNPHTRRQPIEKVIRYLFAVQTAGQDPQAPGQYLYHIGLVSDLGLTVEQIEARIDRNSNRVEILTQPDKPLLAKIEALKLRLDTVQGELFRRLRDNEGTDPETWLPQMLEWNLTFERWPEPDIRLPDEPPNLTFDPLSKFRGMQEEQEDFVTYTTTPITVSWRLIPANPDYLSHYVLTLLRAEREDEELLPVKRVAAGKRSCKFDLKNVDLDEDEGRVTAQLEIRAISLEGETVATDLSDPFWIEKGEGLIEDLPTQRNPHGDEVRSIAEALLIGALRLRAKSNRQMELAVRFERSGWASSSKAKDAIQDIYRIRLTTNELFHLKFVPALRDTERSILDLPKELRTFHLNLSSVRSGISQQVESESISMSDEKLVASFLEARAILFTAIVKTTPGALIELTDLRLHTQLVLNYARAYYDLLHEPSFSAALSRLDTLQVQLSNAHQALILAPTHPLRLLWLLQYQRLLGQWTDGILAATSKETHDLLDRASLDRITSLNAPAFLATATNCIWVNTDNLNLFWSIFLPAPVEHGREALSSLYRLLRIPAGKADVSTIRAEQLAERIALYLNQHPYIHTLVLNVINPGDGLIILDTLRRLQQQQDYAELNYELRFFGAGSYDQLGIAFDELMNQTDEQRGQDVDDAFLAANPNPLLPKLTFAKHRISSLIDTPDRSFDAHLTILLDHFHSSIYTLPVQPVGSRGSSSLHGLLTEFQSNYHTDRGILWSRSIQPNSCLGLERDDHVVSLLFESHIKGLQAVASLIPNSQLGEIPAIQLPLSPEELGLINRIHACSDWVLTVDRNFGIEYFDNPEPLTSYRESYLIDYTPEFLSDIGHRLIISTAWLSEIETILARSLRDLDLLSEQLRPLDMLNALRSLSGRIALQVLSQPMHNEPLIGLGLSQIILIRSGRLQDAVLIPASAHSDLFGSSATNTLALVHFEGHNLHLNLVAVRFSKGTSIGDEYIAREEIHLETQQTETHILAQLALGSQSDLLDQVLRNKAWTNVLNFYLERAIRYGLLAEDSQIVLNFRIGLDALHRNEAAITIDREGLIFNLQGVTKPIEDYHGVQVQVIGRDELIGRFGGIASTGVTRTTEQLEISSAQLPVTEPAEPQKQVDTPGIGSQRTEGNEGQTKLLEIELGTSSDTGRSVVWAPFRPHPRRLTNQHILIVGKSGSGKTQTIMMLAYELWQRRVASLIFDFHGEYCDAFSQPFRDAIQAEVVDAARGIPINPLTVPTDPITDQAMDYRNVIYQVTESLTDIFGLGDIQKRILKRAIENAYLGAGFSRDSATWKLPAPPFAAIWKELRAIEREEGGTTRSLLARVEPIFEAEIFHGEDQTFEDLVHKVTIVRLSSLANKELRTAISRFFLQKVYERMLTLGPSPSDQQRLFCVIDEAHKLSHDPTITDLIKEARKYGVGLILSSQETRDFDRSIFANTGTIIALQLEVEDARIIVDNLGLQQPTERTAAVEIILRQHPGLAIVRNNHHQPYTQVQIIPFLQRLKSP